MPQVAIDKFKNIETTPESLLENIESMIDSIRERAYNIFENRYYRSLSDMDDWLQAEREVLFSPASELIDEEKEFRAQIALPGFDAKDIHISAMPNELVIQADASHTHEGKKGRVCFCEFSGKNLFRRLEMPATIDVDGVTASLDKGVLEINAPKAATKRLATAA